ncbi:MAG: T9SS type A sorting domain-containing protein [Bacteroidia bacterium]|nr:T9SS type A sorting domain-containing protein [Bacteroidia bacterium]NNK55262.1 T9SS type A sorting domain-containing protein [Flavobacteriaceae bacterium]NNM10257.1 T9SS type A sorting domain-containing protein [Flavobacteriaceae bacterium]
MKTKILFLIVGLICLTTNSQIQFDEHIIGPIVLPRVVKAADIDGDSDLDVIAGTSGNWSIVWYENMDGQGNYGPKNGINTTIGADSHSLHIADLDGDNDMDILVANNINHILFWFENTDGLGNFGPEQYISTEAASPSSVYASDLDNDGDMDVLSASTSDNKIAWYENDGLGSFGPQQIITTNALGANSVYTADMDGDGDMDVLSASTSDNKIAWYENDGIGSFGPQQIISLEAEQPGSVYACDIDRDGDVDVLSASWADNKIAWYENGGLGSFGPQQIISTNAEGAGSVYADDLDDDGDMDVLSVSYSDKKIAWYENDGLGSFGPQQIISIDDEVPTSVYADDLDGDGDMDVLSAWPEAYKIAWFENLGPLGIEDHNSTRFNIYPIPTKGILNFESNTTIIQIDIYNQLGQLVFSANDTNTIDISSLDQGLYYCKVLDENGTTGSKKILKQ